MQNNKLIVKLAQKKDKKKIQEFINLNYKRNHILVKNQELFKWQYQSTKLNCVIAKVGNKLVGIYLYIPLSHFDKKLLKNNQFFGSLWTVNEFQNDKNKNLKKENIIIALKLFQNTFKLLKFDLDVAVGLDSRFYRFHKSQNYKKIKKLNHHFMISPFVKQFKILDNFAFSKFKNLNKNKLKVKFEKIKSEVHLNKLNIEDLFNHQLPTKSKTYLINRYLKHPIYKYDIYTISRNKIMCLCIFRIIKFKNRNIIRFIDFVGPNNSFLFLKNFFIEVLKKYDAEYLDFYSHGIPLKILNKSGLIKKQEKIIIPNYFEPFVYKNIDISVGYRKYNNIKGEVRIFKGDGDQDRPTTY